jgi:hypothetical protein
MAKLVQSLNWLKFKSRALVDIYPIELTKEIYTSMYIDRSMVSLIVNMTNNGYNAKKPIHLLKPVERPYTLRYNLVHLNINIAFVQV